MASAIFITRMLQNFCNSKHKSQSSWTTQNAVESCPTCSLPAKTNAVKYVANVNFVLLPNAPLNKSGQWVCFETEVGWLTNTWQLITRLRQRSNSVWVLSGLPPTVFILRTLLHSDCLDLVDLLFSEQYSAIIHMHHYHETWKSKPHFKMHLTLLGSG